VKIVEGRKIRVALIGCGRISAKHLEAIAEHQEHLELVAVCDEVMERAVASAELWGCKAYADISQMMDECSLDLVAVATPNGLHPSHVIFVAGYGVNVITEKPMALSLADGMRMIEVCKHAGVGLFVVHQNRFNDTSWHISQALKEVRFGRIYMVSSNVFWNRDQSYYEKEGSWHGTKALDGGAFYTQASHYIDFMQWVVGYKPRSIFANFKTLARNIETEDSGVATIEWENGTLGSIDVTMLTYPRNLEGSITILGENGTVKIGGVAMNQILHWEFLDQRPADVEVMQSNYDTTSVYGFGHARYYENVISALRGVAKPMVDGQEGLHSLRLLVGMYHSAATGAVIAMDSLL
jgi:UDP-N-acetyl-2-amino-2-deoxyglucuronate dehydrogenase